MKRAVSSAKGGKRTQASAKPPVKKPARKVVKKISAKTSVKAPAKTSAKPSVKKTAKTLKKTPKKAAKKVAKKTAVKTPVKKAAKAAKKSIAKTASKTKGLAKRVVKTVKAAPVKTPPVKPAPSKTSRPKTFPARAAEKSFGFGADVPELPETYGEDRLVLMTQDPEYLFTYWEITPEQFALSEQAKRDGEEYREALRLRWTAQDLFSPNFALLPVSLAARKGYLRVPFSGLSYQVEIGWVSDQGHFISILGHSNPSDAPESWAQTRRRLKTAAGDRSVLEYNLGITNPLGSSELGRGQEAAAGRAADWDFEGPGSLSSSASSGAAVRKIPAARAATPPKTPSRSSAKRPAKLRR